MTNRRKASNNQIDPATANFEAAHQQISQVPIFRYLLSKGIYIQRNRDTSNLCPPEAWAVVTSDGRIYVNPFKRAEPAEWVYLLSHCILHLAFGHFQARPYSREWQAACNYYIARFLFDLKLGFPPDFMPNPGELTVSSEDRLYEMFRQDGIPDYVHALSPAGPKADNMIYNPPNLKKDQLPDWPSLFAQGLADSVNDAVSEAALRDESEDERRTRRIKTRGERCRAWFVNHYPLLASLAVSFKLIEDWQICNRLNISIAAVDSEMREIYLNPQARLNEDQLRFVMAHELLHVGLRHEVRRQGRDPYFWNVACDYVINGWLAEMNIGELPEQGLLYDPDLKGMSAEAIYDLIVSDLRRFRKLMTFRGSQDGLGDMIDHHAAEWWVTGKGVELDEFYRQCLAQGLFEHQKEGRGLIPAGLVEQINALYQPPIPWDVELAQWFDENFAPLEKRRTYARLSRRQSSTPDIPRPSWRIDQPLKDSRTFGVVLDTSGSMDRNLLAKALGAIASYSESHDVGAVRVVFCDAAAYDQGYMAPETIAGRVKVRGRGGTILQPGINLLENAADFPKEGPILVITDGHCDRLQLHREHAFLIPFGQNLPFVPVGKVFRLK